MGELTSGCEVLSASVAGSVIQCTFGGVHHWTHGPQMTRYVETVLAQTTASGIVIDLLDYSCEFGNDIFGLFTVGLDRAARRMRPVCIVARGKTRASLESLLGAGKVGKAFDITLASTTAEVVEWLHNRLDQARGGVTTWFGRTCGIQS